MGRRVFQVLVLPFRREMNSIQYAVFLRADWPFWQWVSGGGEIGETPLVAAKRETWEETGISQESPYTELDSTASIPADCFRDLADPDVSELPEHAFGVEVCHSDLRISHEHTEYRWVGYDEAMGLLKWDSNKAALRDLDARLRGRI